MSDTPEFVEPARVPIENFLSMTAANAEAEEVRVRMETADSMQAQVAAARPKATSEKKKEA